VSFSCTLQDWNWSQVLKTRTARLNAFALISPPRFLACCPCPCSLSVECRSYTSTKLRRWLFWSRSPAEGTITCRGHRLPPSRSRPSTEVSLAWNSLAACWTDLKTSEVYATTTGMKKSSFHTFVCKKRVAGNINTYANDALGLMSTTSPFSTSLFSHYHARRVPC
jgi:hypothetical protein